MSAWLCCGKPGHLLIFYLLFYIYYFGKPEDEQKPVAAEDKEFCTQVCQTEHGVTHNNAGQSYKKSTYAMFDIRCGKLSGGLCGTIKKGFWIQTWRSDQEIDESCFWLEFLVEEKLLTDKQTSLLLAEANELTAIFIASRKTSRLKQVASCK